MHGLANNVAVRIGEWTGSINFSIIAMDDYACVLGMDFMDKVKAIPIPFANSLCFVENGGASMVPLKRKVELAAVTTQPNPSLLECIVEGLQHDPQAKLLLELIGQGKTHRFWRDDQGLVQTRWGAVFVPRWGYLRKQVISECHDTRWAGLPGAQRIQALVERRFYWPRMVDDIQLFVKTCLVC
ncbi:hypothetical protein GH714_041085 [Hevea brasiliensis]|uniref:Integrase zinc-binding domain-containing protein n=1 Tax=Hevea brasiliensis TaxID=3981 RepID=A0A6A6MZC3_HEVBR|nr:hypothetical protein GH714_041085 [Hevea brasiliensis]